MDRRSDSQYYLNNPGYNAVSGRPVWQAQQVATRIKSSGARIFIIAETPDMSRRQHRLLQPGWSGRYEQRVWITITWPSTATALANIYNTIRDQINLDRCVPYEITQQAANATMVLTQPSNPTWSMSTVADSSGGYSFGNLTAGDYVLKVNPAPTLTSSEDGLARSLLTLAQQPQT